MINFKKVRYKNLLSSGNKFTEIQLDQHQTTLILGDNGAGKSTLLDALCFGMYGKGFRNLKKDLLINSINGGNLLVEVEFSIGKKEYKVIRGAKPNKFELYVNDVFVNQDRPRRQTFVVCTQIFTFIAKVQETGPLIECDSSVRLLLFSKRAKGFQPFIWDSAL